MVVVRMLHRYKPKLHYYPVKQTFLDTCCVEHNTVGANRGNCGEISYVFYTRDYRGNLIYTEANSRNHYQYGSKNNDNVKGFKTV